MHRFFAETIARVVRFADANTLYFTSQFSSKRDGLFGAITTGLVSTTRVSVPATPTEAPVTITVDVSAGAGNAGTPTGSVEVRDGKVGLANPALSEELRCSQTH